jgi:hypothetical protein
MQGTAFYPFIYKVNDNYAMTATAFANEAQEAYEEIKSKYLQLEAAVQKHFPKVDSKLVRDLLIHSSSGTDASHLFSLEVLAKEGTSAEKARDYFIQKTGKVPAAYEKGTHFLVNVKLTFELLKDIQSYPEVEFMTGGYIGTTSTVQQTHLHRGRDEQSRMVNE